MGDNSEEEYQIRRQIIQQYVDDNQLVELQSYYYGEDSYYHDPKKDLIYKVCEEDQGAPVFEIVDDKNIRNWNGI
jgi:hypothetical protein